MRRASILAVAALAATGVLALADVASAQSAPAAGQAQGLRYLSWQGRGEPAAPSTRDGARPAPARTDLRRPNTVIPHGGFAASEPPAPRRLSPAPGPARRTLTPANAWLQPAAVPPEPAPAPVPPAPSAPAPQPSPGPDYLPDQGRRGQPAPAEAVYPAPLRQGDASVTDAAADPMAPRRDAPIFRMQQAAPAPQPEAPSAVAPPAEAPAQPRRVAEVADSGERPPQQGARYYSVHRQNGREPDALVMPTPTYVDALVVSMTETPATQDLAEPAQGPTLIRDRDGNMRATPAASDGDHQ